MYKEVIRTANTITVIDPYTVTSKTVFTRVNKIPEGFEVWNIPEIAPDVVPLAERTRPGDPDCYEINPATLKYLEIEPEKAARLREAGHAGAGNLKECKKRLDRKDNYIRTRARAALKVFEEIANR